MITVHPAARAAAAFLVTIAIGKFHFREKVRNQWRFVEHSKIHAHIHY